MDRSFVRRLFLSLALVAALATTGLATQPDLTQEDRVRLSRLIVSGKVESVFTTTEDTEAATATHYVVALVVSEVSKGDGATPKKVLLFRGSSFALKEGHQGGSGVSAPSPGHLIKAYLELRPDGTYQLLSPNGYENCRR
jgi:hypothetical protein